MPLPVRTAVLLDPPPVRRGRHRMVAPAAFAATLLLAAGAAQAGDLVVRVAGLAESVGQVGCALFSAPDGFPMDNTGARVQWQPAQAGGVSCRFPDVPAGRYAVSIAHDLNANRRVDTNFLGMPTEAWGVSNDVRPALRPPRFDEAAFSVGTDTGEKVVEVKVSK